MAIFQLGKNQKSAKKGANIFAQPLFGALIIAAFLVATDASAQRGPPTRANDNQDGTEATTQGQPTIAAPGSFDEAVICAAALQLGVMAAPNWGREEAVAASSNLWLSAAFDRAEAANIAGNDVIDLVRREMEQQLTDAADDPSKISGRAFGCAANRPS